ncbi:putative nuclease HARBI1 [Lates japonicus]|uniref:Nuclease HARBI1 n=1 Tax=Lates japonicus TaxID=270547 RepID=A0AAD3NHQ9_LATJO|nr:putative nuclease HARBI1 [Lates japonicus]
MEMIGERLATGAWRHKATRRLEACERHGGGGEFREGKWRPAGGCWGVDGMLDQPSQYCVLNCQVPVLAMYFNGQSDLQPDVHPSRPTVARLIHILCSPFDHVPVLADKCNFLPCCVKSFWHPTLNIIHRVTQKIIRLKNRVICFPPPDEHQTIGAGFERLAGSAAFAKAVGSIDGCNIRINPPNADAQWRWSASVRLTVWEQLCGHISATSSFSSSSGP